jgi:hypothetical protein
MSEFQSWDSFETFSTSIRETSRFCLNSEAREFLETVQATSMKRKRVIPKGSIYWRARKGHTLGHKHPPFDDLPVLLPYPEVGMKPLPKSPSDGRCTPKDMPSYVYVASDATTAISELRPAVGDYISVAKIELALDVLLVDCTGYEGDDYVHYADELPPEERESVVWAAIGRAFSIPVNPEDSIRDYIPTQAIAERLRIAGFAGLTYRSRLGKGLNLAIFDVGTVQVRERTIHRIENVDYQFRDITEDGVPASKEYFTTRWKAPND